MQDFKKNTHEVLKIISTYEGDEYTYLVALINIIRASKDQLSKGINEDFDDLIYWIETYPELSEGLKNYLLRLCQKKHISTILTDADMVSGIDFWSELWHRIILKFLPEKSDEESIEGVLSEVFYKESDGRWINDLDNSKCLKLLKILDIKGLYELDSQNFIIQELLFSLKVLSYRISGYALDSKLMKMMPKYSGVLNPFIALQNEVNIFIRDIDKDISDRNITEINHRQILVITEQCKAYINATYESIPESGISFREHQYLILIEKILERLIDVLNIINVESTVNSEQKLIRLIKSLITFTSGKSKISEYINKSTQIYAREITRNIAIKGEEYITSDTKGYWKMFRSALGGGAVVALACFIKMNLSGVEVSLFGKALFYSLNYCFAFVAIYLLHFTLATKQPAMTAATLAQNLKDGILSGNDFSKVADLVSRIFRSQFIAFTGNVFMAFPVALLMMLGWSYIFGHNMSEYKAISMIQDLNLLHSPAIFHAAIAGVFLFISGLIAGNIANRNKNKHIAARIREHPVLKQFMAQKWRDTIAVFFDQYWPGIVSNIWFGVFMGSVSSVGIIFGLDLDIRHITFAAGNFALALHGLSYHISDYDIIHSILGIGVIGLVNFSVSFFMSLILAMKSRGIPIRILSDILTAIKTQFKKRPGSFLYPEQFHVNK
jgi:site-specific recombinase